MNSGSPRLSRVAAVQLLAGLVWLLPVAVRPTGIPFWRGGEYSDLLISHWPNAWFVRRSLTEWGQLPLWNPMILAGAPFAADPLSGIWYPPTWLAVLFPAGLAFNVLFWLHLAWAGTGMWLLLRRIGLAAPAAWVGSLAFSGAPKLIGHIGLGHLGLVSAVCWTPWVLLAVVVATDARQAGWLEPARRSALAGGCLGLSFLADPRWALPLAALSLATATWWIAHSHRQNRRSAWNLVGRASVGLLFSLLVAAVLALPLQEFAARSTRATLSLTEGGASGLPPARMLGILAPDLGGWPEWQAYAGITLLALGLVALWSRAEGSGFWAAIALGCLLLALGDATSLHGLLVRVVPGYGLLRMPARWLFGMAFGMAVLGGIGLNRLIQRPFDGHERSRLTLTIFGLFALLAALGGAVWIAGGESGGAQAVPFALSLVWLGAMLWWIGPGRRRVHSDRWLALGWAVMVVLDLALVDISEIESRKPLPDQNATIAALSSRLTPELAERAFSPSYSLPQPQAALAGLELVDGVNPLQLTGVRDYMAAATGFDAERYSVTLPPFPEGDPQRPWPVRPDAVLLGRLNVAFLASAYPVQQDGWAFVGAAGGAFIYRNAWVRPRAWVELGDANASWRAVTDLAWTPNRIRLQADGPGLLVLSEMAYPGWQVRVNGQAAEWQAGREPLRSLSLTDGSQQIELSFRPWTVYAGAAITMVGLSVLAALWVVRR